MVTYPYINATSGLASDTTVWNYQYNGGPLASVTTSGYGSSQPATFVSRTVNYGYGHAGELLHKSGDTYPVQYSYDGLYRLSTISYMQNGTYLPPTIYHYDDVGNLLEVDYPGANGNFFDREVYGYDGDGNILSRTDGNDVVTDYIRDDGVNMGSSSTPDDRIMSVMYPSDAALDVSYGYNTFERLNSLQKGSSPYTTKSYVFDDLSLTTTANYSFANGPSNKGWMDLRL